MRIVITGGSGLVGRRITALLSGRHDVVNVDLREPEVPVGTYLPADILDADAVRRALEGADAVVHSAAIPGPDQGTPEDIYMTNTKGTETVASAAADVGILRFVQISSEAVLGFVFARGKNPPSYFPVDEEHPLSPSEPYGRSKLLAEQALADARPEGGVVVCLRPPWVWVPEEYPRCRQLTRDPSMWSDSLWAYIHGDDLAGAAGLAIERELEPGFHAYYVAAPDNGTIIPTRKLLEQYYPCVPRRPGISQFGGLISSGRAARQLGFNALLTWRQFLGQPQ